MCQLTAHVFTSHISLVSELSSNSLGSFFSPAKGPNFSPCKVKNRDQIVPLARINQLRRPLGIWRPDSTASIWQTEKKACSFSWKHLFRTVAPKEHCLHLKHEDEASTQGNNPKCCLHDRIENTTNSQSEYQKISGRSEKSILIVGLYLGQHLRW